MKVHSSGLVLVEFEDMFFTGLWFELLAIFLLGCESQFDKHTLQTGTCNDVPIKNHNLLKYRNNMKYLLDQLSSNMIVCRDLPICPSNVSSGNLIQPLNIAIFDR